MDPIDPDGIPGVRIHYADLHPDDITVVDGIPVTAPGRTLLDLASTQPERVVRDALRVAFARSLTDAEELVGVMTRYPGHPGIPRLAWVLERYLRRR